MTTAAVAVGAIVAAGVAISGPWSQPLRDQLSGAEEPDRVDNNSVVPGTSGEDVPQGTGSQPRVSSLVSTTGDVPVTPPSGVLPFDRASISTLRASSKKVWAHYLPSLPRSIDNKTASTDYYTVNYLNPNGESGKHKAYGGFVRDRPLPRDPISGDWKAIDAQAEVAQALQAGVDGFAVDLLQFPVGTSHPLYDQTVRMLSAAAVVDSGFKIMLMPDMTALTSFSSDDTAKYLAALGKYSAAYRLADGRLVISPFHAESRSADWWKQCLAAMESKYGTKAVLFPVLVDDSATSWLMPISYGMSSWGSRNPLWNATGSTSSQIKATAGAKSAGRLWMQPISVQDERPRAGVYEESENTTNLRNTWEIAIKAKADWAQLISWNDYAEGTQFAPSAKHGWSYLDLSAYYAQWFKLGAAPTIVRDTVYISHRTQPVSAKQTFGQSLLMKLRGGSNPRDTVEALAFLTQPGTVSVTVGGVTTSCAAPAGVSACTVPLRAGSVSAVVVRSGRTVVSVSSPYTVTTSPYTQDLQYVAVSSGRSGTASPAPSTSTSSPTPTPTPTPTPSSSPTQSANSSVSAIQPLSDSYADKGTRKSNFGSSSSLGARGGDLPAVSYLRFSLPNAPSGKKLVSATLRLQATNISAAGSTVTQRVWLSQDGWTEGDLNWKKQPRLTSVQLGTVPAGVAANSTVRVSLSTSAVSFRLGRQVTFAIQGTGTDGLWFWSKEYATSSARPTLELVWQ